mmetsp:Transcript_7526/g.10923  ORF Transcript_7526/g.10923 Transcript_7526/m.10923 type:complete len:83 (-) Transcript_7526:331-579(-)
MAPFASSIWPVREPATPIHPMPLYLILAETPSTNFGDGAAGVAGLAGINKGVAGANIGNDGAPGVEGATGAVGNNAGTAGAI